MLHPIYDEFKKFVHKKVVMYSKTLKSAKRS